MQGETIAVKRQENKQFLVTVKGATGSTEHTVTLTNDYYQKLTGGNVPPEKLIEASFVFLLEREPKESILSRFDLSVIQNYFPEYERKIKNLS